MAKPRTSKTKSLMMRVICDGQAEDIEGEVVDDEG